MGLVTFLRSPPSDGTLARPKSYCMTQNIPYQIASRMREAQQGFSLALFQPEPDTGAIPLVTRLANLI